MHIMKLTQMGNAPKGEVTLLKMNYGASWHCTAQGQNDGMQFKASGDGDTASDAIDACYTRWLKLTDALPEIMGRLPAPETEDAHDGDSMIQPQASTTFDDIPF